MSSIAMAADSTQSDLREDIRRKKLKKKDTSKRKKKEGKGKKGVRKKRDGDSEASECDSDLDLSKELKPISSYICDRELTIQHLFRSISTKKMKAMLPEILKPIPLEELKQLCLEQLECMSRKRIKRLLQGADPETISSSGTDDDDLSTDEAHRQGGGSADDARSDLVVDSTCQNSEDEDAADRSGEDVTRSRSPTPSDRSGVAEDDQSPGSYVSRSGTSERRSSWSSQYGVEGSDAESRGSSYYYDSSGTETEYVEEVVVEEIFLDAGDDLEQVLRTRVGGGYQQVIEESETDQVVTSEHTQHLIEDGNCSETAEVRDEDPGNMEVDSKEQESADQGQTEVTEGDSLDAEETPAEAGESAGKTEEMDTNEHSVCPVTSAIEAVTENNQTEETQPDAEHSPSPSPGQQGEVTGMVDSSGDIKMDMEENSAEAKASTDVELQDPIDANSTKEANVSSQTEKQGTGDDLVQVSGKETPIDISMEQKDTDKVGEAEEKGAADVGEDADMVVQTTNDPPGEVTDMVVQSTDDPPGEVTDMVVQSTDDPPGEVTDVTGPEADQEGDLEEGELEEGELEDSSGDEEADRYHDDVMSRSGSEVEEENLEQVVDFPKTRKREKKRKKKVKVIKRIIKVIRRKPPPVEASTEMQSKVEGETKTIDESESQHQDVQKTKLAAKTNQSVSSGTEKSAAKTGSKKHSSHETKPKPTALPSSSKSEPGAIKDSTEMVEEKALNKMEILELEMRARAIKAMLRKHEDSNQTEDGSQTQTKTKRIKLKRN